MMMGILMRLRRSCRQTSQLAMPGSMTSRMIRSKACSEASRYALGPPRRPRPRTSIAKSLRRPSANRRVVLDDEQTVRHDRPAAGSSMVKVLPCPRSLTSRHLPAVTLGDVLDNRQPEPRAGNRGRAVTGDPNEFPEMSWSAPRLTPIHGPTTLEEDAAVGRPVPSRTRPEPGELLTAYPTVPQRARERLLVHWSRSAIGS